MTTDARHECVDAPVVACPADAADDPKLIATRTDERRWRRPVLLCTELQTKPVVPSASEEPAILIRRLVAGCDVGSRRWNRVPHAPTPEIDAHFLSSLFDR